MTLGMTHARQGIKYRVPGTGRLTNAFSKKMESHCHALSIYFMHYNFCRIHQTTRVTPAMASGVTGKLWDMQDVVRMIDEYEARPDGDPTENADLARFRDAPDTYVPGKLRHPHKNLGSGKIPN